MVSATTFPALVSGQSYKPSDHTAYTAGTKSAQVLGIYKPLRAANTYWVNRNHPDTYATMICPRFSGFQSDMTHASSGTALTSTYGLMWQYLMAGIACVPIALTAPNTTGAEGAPVGKGLYHAPGGRQRYYESKNRQSAWKDMQFAFQQTKRNARLGITNYSILCPEAMGICGVSAGGNLAASLAFHPSHAWSLGAFGAYTESTVPTCLVAGLGVFHWWERFVDIFDTIGTAGAGTCHFPLAEEGGAGADDTTSTNMGAAPIRYQRASSALSWISQPGSRCIAPTFVANDTAAVNLQIGMPYTTKVETDRHTMWSPLSIRNIMPAGLVDVRLRHSVIGSVPTDLYDGEHYAGGTDLTGDVDQAGQLEMYTERPDGGKSGPEINFTLEHINDRPWDAVIPPEGITRRSQVETTGRFAVPVTPGRGGIEVTCCGPRDLLVSDTPYNNGALARVEPGRTYRRKGDGPIWLAAADGGEGVASYVIRELPTGALA